MDSNRINHSPSQFPDTVNIVRANGLTVGMTEYFSQSTITFGRSPSCDVVFPTDVHIVSRLHAMISRHGNQYILKNLSPNGSYVNGIKKEECLIKAGDLISFANGGPVIAFTLSTSSKNNNNPIESTPLVEAKKLCQAHDVHDSDAVLPPTLLTQASTDFTFQYGTTIKSFHQIKVVVGKGPCCDFVISHPQVNDIQFEIHYRDNKYLLLDLSENNSTYVNNDNFIGDIRLESGDIITLSTDSSVQLHYLGEGRMSEYNPEKYKDSSCTEGGHKVLPRHTPHEDIGTDNKH